MCRSPLMPPPRLFGGCARRRRGTFLNSLTSPSSQTVLTAHRVAALLSERQQTDGGRGEWGRGIVPGLPSQKRIEHPEKSLVWDGETGNVSFLLAVPASVPVSPRKASASVRVNGCEIAIMDFL